MPDRKEILSELNSISPELEKIPFGPVFTVPAGYFEDFASKMLAIIQKMEKTEVMTELESISPLLASIDRKNPFTVPDGYFANLEDKLTVPEGYGSREPKLGVAEGYGGLEPKLTEPEGYLSGVGDEVPQLQLGAKVVSIGSNNRYRFMYAAAAIVAFLGIFTWFFVINRADQDTPTRVATVNIHSELPKLSAAEMTKYLESAPEDLNFEPISLAGVEDIDLDAIMDGIHESELQQFINENPGLTEKNIN